MTNGSSAARQDLRRRRGLSKLEQGYMGFILIPAVAYRLLHL